MTTSIRILDISEIIRWMSIERTSKHKQTNIANIRTGRGLTELIF